MTTALAAAEPQSLTAGQVPSREQIEAVEGFLLQLPQRTDLRVRTWLHGGMLYRETLIPEDTFATGVVHLRDHISTMVYGDMTAMTDKGMQRVTGFNTWAANAGIKRIGYAHAETLWLTAHRTDATTVEEAENELFENADSLLTRRLAAAEIEANKTKELQ